MATKDFALAVVLPRAAGATLVLFTTVMLLVSTVVFLQTFRPNTTGEPGAMAPAARRVAAARMCPEAEHQAVDRELTVVVIVDERLGLERARDRHLRVGKLNDELVAHDLQHPTSHLRNGGVDGTPMLGQRSGGLALLVVGRDGNEGRQGDA